MLIVRDKSAVKFSDESESGSGMEREVEVGCERR